jgi:hypothetical protein
MAWMANVTGRLAPDDIVVVEHEREIEEKENVGDDDIGVDAA